jgi:hypothetical protein
MSVFVDSEWQQLPRATVIATEETRAAKVTYQGDGGKKFTVMIRQKPNAIGFAARLPGDRQKLK